MPLITHTVTLQTEYPGGEPLDGVWSTSVYAFPPLARDTLDHNVIAGKDPEATTGGLAVLELEETGQPNLEPGDFRWQISFVSRDRNTRLGPYIFDLTEDMTLDEIAESSGVPVTSSILTQALAAAADTAADRAAVQAAVGTLLVPGLDPTGIAPAAAIIQAVIDTGNAFYNATGAGSTVQLPRGVFNIDTGLVVKEGVTLRGSGAGTILRFVNAANFYCVKMGAADGDTDMHARDLVVEGDGDKTMTANNLAVGIGLGGPGYGIQNSSVTDCWVRAVAGFGIATNSGCTDILIAENHIYDVGNTNTDDGHAVSTESASRCIIANNTIRDTRARGIEVYSGSSDHSTEVTVIGNTMYNVTATGIAVFSSGVSGGYVRGVTVTGNTISVVNGGGASLGDGVWIGDYCDNVTVANNTITAPTRHGIWVAMELGGSSVGWEKRCTITGNVIYYAGTFGIFLDVHALGYCSLSNNQVRASFRDGIFAQDCDYLAINGNVCTDNNRRGAGVGTGAGIQLYLCNRVALTGNVCTDAQAVKTQTHGIIAAGGDYLAVVANVLGGNATGTKYLEGSNNQVANNIEA